MRSRRSGRSATHGEQSVERVCVDAGRGICVEHAIYVRWEGICGQSSGVRWVQCVASRGRRRILGCV